MIIGIGSDIVDIRRIEQIIEQQGDKFIDRIFTKKEQATCDGRQRRVAAYAKRFAAKEACAKALSSGIGSDAFFTDIEISNDERGAPFITLYGKALARLEHITPSGKEAGIFVSLADERDYAQAQVIIEAL